MRSDRALPLTIDHDPRRPDERVSNQQRVDRRAAAAPQTPTLFTLHTAGARQAPTSLLAITASGFSLFLSAAASHIYHLITQQDRIRAAGGSILNVNGPRVMGALSMTR